MEKKVYQCTFFTYENVNYTRQSPVIMLDDASLWVYASNEEGTLISLPANTIVTERERGIN